MYVYGIDVQILRLRMHFIFYLLTIYVSLSCTYMVPMVKSYVSGHTSSSTSLPSLFLSHVCIWYRWPNPTTPGALHLLPPYHLFFSLMYVYGTDVQILRLRAHFIFYLLTISFSLSCMYMVPMAKSYVSGRTSSSTSLPSLFLSHVCIWYRW